jgi:translation initiation factor IF-3
MNLKKPPQAPQKRTRINNEIRAAQVRVVDPNGKHGVYSIEDALALAENYGVDLVEIAPDADPPVCKVVDYGKYLYEQQKKEKEARKKSHAVVLKEIRFRPQTDTHDFEFKAKHARQFLEEGNMVKAWVQFRGRDILYKEHGESLLKRFIEELKEVGRVDQAPRMEGRRMTLIMAPAKKKG